jgi:hypothetical protein
MKDGLSRLVVLDCMLESWLLSQNEFQHSSGGKAQDGTTRSISWRIIALSRLHRRKAQVSPGSFMGSAGLIRRCPLAFDLDAKLLDYVVPSTALFGQIFLEVVAKYAFWVDASSADAR